MQQENYVEVFGILSITTIIIMTASTVFLAMLLVYALYLLLIKRVGTLSLILSFTLSIIWAMFQLSESENPRINELANSVEALVLFLSGDVDIGGSIEWRIG